MSFLNTLWADIKYAVTHPETIRKAILGAATTILGDLAVFNTVVPHLPAQIQAGVAGVTAVLTAVVVFLTPNAPSKDQPAGKHEKVT